MLYLSTRNRTDSFTAFRALREDSAPDGGMYVPMRMPFFNKEEIEILKDQSFGQTVAMILNLFFTAKLTSWDVEFCVGRYPLKLISMNHRMIIAEMWHNLDSDYRYMENSLYRKLCGQDVASSRPTQWAKIAIRIAVLFALYGELARKGFAQFDVCMSADDFTLPMSAWYAREMGLPIGTIICSGKDNGAAWDLIHRGEFNTGTGAVCPAGFERLIYGTLGLHETVRYVNVCSRKGIYKVSEEALSVLNCGLYACVASENRIESVSRSIFRTSDYIADPDTALAYGGLQDYRSHTGDSQPTLLLSYHSPIHYADTLTATLGITATEIKRRLNNA